MPRWLGILLGLIVLGFTWTGVIFTLVLPRALSGPGRISIWINRVTRGVFLSMQTRRRLTIPVSRSRTSFIPASVNESFIRTISRDQEMSGLPLSLAGFRSKSNSVHGDMTGSIVGS